MIFTAYPHKGVNDIEFGMTAKMVSARMSGRLKIGDIRTTTPEHPTYSYPDVPVFFYFDENGHLEGIEFCAGSDVRIAGVNLLGLRVRDAIAALQRLDPDAIVDDEGAVSHKLDVALWCPNIDDEEDEEPVETLLLAKPGYFEFREEPLS